MSGSSMPGTIRIKSVNAVRRAVNLARSLDVQHGKALRILDFKATIVPICLVSTLFFMWGLLYGLLDIMNYHVKVAMGISTELAAVLALAYYIAYIPGTIGIGSNLVTKCGYRVAMASGLLILGIGSLIMSLGASRMSFGGMAGGQFIVGLGVSTLERSANPYATNCGPRFRAALRLLFAQAWAGIGTVVAPFLANAFVFVGHGSNMNPLPDPLHPGKCLVPKAAKGGNLDSVVTFYRGLAAVIFGITVALTVIFFRTHWVPEVAQPRAPATTCGIKLWKHPLVSSKYGRLWWGVFANFWNLGCQVAVAQFFIEHMTVNTCSKATTGATYMSYAQIAFVAGRFAAALLVTMPHIFKPRVVLLGFLLGAIAFSAASTTVTGTAAIICAAMIMFFEACSFPMIFESATAGFGEWASTAETITITSIFGGGILPLIMGALTSHFGVSRSWTLVACCFGLVSTYAIANNVFPSFRRAIDAAEQDEIPVDTDEERTLRGSAHTILTKESNDSHLPDAQQCESGTHEALPAVPTVSERSER